MRSPTPTVRRFAIAYGAPTPGADPLPVRVRVALLDVADVYNREGIVYRDGAQEMGTYSGFRWMTTPPRMVTDLLTRDLAATEVYAAVVTGGVPVSAGYVLGGTVERMEEAQEPEGCVAQLDLRLVLTGPTDLLFQRPYRASVPCAGHGPEAFAAAMSVAMAHLSRAVRADVYAAIRADVTREAVDRRPN